MKKFEIKKYKKLPNKKNYFNYEVESNKYE